MALNESETNELLERFDQTDRAMQSKIVAHLVERCANLEQQNADLLAACLFVRAHECADHWCYECYREVGAAIAKVTKGA